MTLVLFLFIYHVFHLCLFLCTVQDRIIILGSKYVFQIGLQSIYSLLIEFHYFSHSVVDINAKDIILKVVICFGISTSNDYQ